MCFLVSRILGLYACLFPELLYWPQMANLTNMALDKLTAAGVVLVPFNSSNLDEAASDAWGGGPESTDYELPEALARYGCPACIMAAATMTSYTQLLAIS